MNFSHDLQKRVATLTVACEERARIALSEWLLSYQGAGFERAAAWVLDGGFGELAPDAREVGWKAMTGALDELRANAHADAYSGWGDQPRPEQVLKAVEAYLLRQVRRPS